MWKKLQHYSWCLLKDIIQSSITRSSYRSHLSVNIKHICIIYRVLFSALLYFLRRWSSLTQKWLMILTSIVLMISLSGVSINLKPVATPALLMRIVTCGRIRHTEMISPPCLRKLRCKARASPRRGEGHRQRRGFTRMCKQRAALRPNDRWEREDARRETFFSRLFRDHPTTYRRRVLQRCGVTWTFIMLFAAILVAWRTTRLVARRMLNEYSSSKGRIRSFCALVWPIVEVVVEYEPWIAIASIFSEDHWIKIFFD